ncbi:hypothetical protein [Alkalihalobacillus pseudalcaliphilus]|uniref:hypothetical protein n=1 Tax=Alkalihalobacillus pseudalcaliphilus TaxID=79884 RepID=UPI00064DA235|nr:hypothetical protein [Alkalihalobacillus pseudalcaliphilus]KMK76288.1 hypothetical protein AB990_13855 [Alkalihalobacillus pseudalcaliphilus]
MDKKLGIKVAINAVAGSGKTSYIVKQLNNETKKSLIITYTQANQQNIKEKIIAKFGYLPANIYVYGYFEFLLNFIIKPLCPYEVENISYENPSYKITSPFTKDKKRIFSNRMAKYIIDKLPEYKNRIDKYFDEVFIDEMQDLASDDFRWMLSLSELIIPVTLVGDFYQSTFASSRRGNHLGKLYDESCVYNEKLEESGFLIDATTLVESYRCTQTVCDFIKEHLEIKIDPKYNIISEIRLIEDIETIEQILEDDSIVKLFYQNSMKFNINSDNWGNSKGMTFNEVCVVLNDSTFNKYKQNKLNELAPLTKKKLYVACTRSNGNLWFIKQNDIVDKYKK